MTCGWCDGSALQHLENVYNFDRMYAFMTDNEYGARQGVYDPKRVNALFYEWRDRQKVALVSGNY